MIALETQRLIVRPASEGDAVALCAYHTRNAERFERWNPARPRETETYAAWIRELASASGAKGSAFLAFEKNEASSVIAEILLTGLSRAPSAAMLSYTVDGAYEGRGFASEAVEAVVAYGFDALGLEGLTAHYDPQNLRSERLLVRTGFRLAGATPVVPGFEHFMRSNAVAHRSR